uniref:Uncharacterized protein n=1 Tax=Heliothis virescens TaxID=7102 RepID=A0A2A4K5P0_HELVI
MVAAVPDHGPRERRHIGHHQYMFGEVLKPIIGQQLRSHGDIATGDIATGDIAADLSTGPGDRDRSDRDPSDRDPSDRDPSDRDPSDQSNQNPLCITIQLISNWSCKNAEYVSCATFCNK